MMDVPYDINNMRQNHPELIVADLSSIVPASVTRHVLKSRGVNKWFRVRRLLIQLKTRWKDEINVLQEKKRLAKQCGDWAEHLKLKGYVEAMTDCRQQVRALCHSPRDVDFPENLRDLGVKCDLPVNFPKRPHKRWFWRRDGLH